jgi:hypothetical protein
MHLRGGGGEWGGSRELIIFTKTQDITLDKLLNLSEVSFPHL